MVMRGAADMTTEAGMCVLSCSMLGLDGSSKGTHVGTVVNKSTYLVYSQKSKCAVTAQLLLVKNQFHGARSASHELELKGQGDVLCTKTEAQSVASA